MVNVVLFMVGLQTIPRETIEAAALDGAVGFRRFISIIFPQLRAVTAVVAKAQHAGLVLGHVSPAVLVDQLVGPMYYRLLVTGEPLTPDYARKLVRSVLGPEESK